MALHGVNFAEWDTLQYKTENTPIPFTNRGIEVKETASKLYKTTIQVSIKLMEHKRRKMILVHRKIQETGFNQHGQHVFINSTTLHKFAEETEEGWGVLANFEDAIKLTNRGKTLKV